MLSGKLVQTDIHSPLLTRYMDNLLFIFDYLILTNSDHDLLMLQIEIKELDDFAQAAFQGYKSLNRIQSHIYQTTYNTNENILVISVSSCSTVLLYVNFIIFLFGRTNECKRIFFSCWQVCAPTGAGKTNIAMISILHEVIFSRICLIMVFFRLG